MLCGINININMNICIIINIIDVAVFSLIGKTVVMCIGVNIYLILIVIIGIIDRDELIASFLVLN